MSQNFAKALQVASKLKDLLKTLDAKESEAVFTYLDIDFSQPKRSAPTILPVMVSGKKNPHGRTIPVKDDNGKEYPGGVKELGKMWGEDPQNIRNWIIKNDNNYVRNGISYSFNRKEKLEEDLKKTKPVEKVRKVKKVAKKK